MAQLPVRVNLSAANFPYVSDFMGRSVILPQNDQNYLRKQRLSGEDSDLDIGVPQIYYGHNVMPTGQGFKSITYSVIITPVVGLLTFDKIIPIKDPSENKGFIGITSDSKIYIYVTGSNTWKDITAAAAGWSGTNTSYAYANGYTYLCLSLHNVYVVDVIGSTITPATLTGITNNLVVGVTAAANYLILYDLVQVYWSSALDPEDFIPSLVTGAGSGVPQDINGQIVACLPFNNGFAIYTTTNIVLASFSGNIRFPWIFRGAPNSSGILTSEHVTFDGDQGTSYAWTSAGLLKIAPSGCVPVNPEASDFLAGRIFEDYDAATFTFAQGYLTAQMRIKLAYIASRYLVISYGVTELTHALVFDTALKRWGKLKVTHADCFEVAQNTESPLPWKTLYDTGATWTNIATTRWSELRLLSNSAAAPKRTMGFLQKDGTVQILVWDYGDVSADAVLILGKFQLTRSRLCSLQQYDVENVDITNTNFLTRIISTLDGKTYVSPIVTPTLLDEGSKIRRYNANVSGMNHSLVFQGAFNMVSVQIALVSEGKR